MNQILKDWLTAADGETYAVGRGLGISLFLFGLLAPTAVAAHTLITKQQLDLPELLTSLAAYLPALTGAVAILIRGTSGTEPSA